MVNLRRLARGVAILAVALAAGHLVQTITSEQQSIATKADLPTQIVQVSAGPEAVLQPPTLASPAPAAAPPLAEAAPVVVDSADLALPPTAPVALLAAVTPDVTLPEPALPLAPVLLPAEPPAPAAAAIAPALPVPALPAPEVPLALAEACPVNLDLIPEAQAMVGITLVAPCHMNERVVLRHAGLAVTARTNATGSLFVTLPAMQVQADVSVLFADQTTVAAEIAVPELATVRRFGVQWMAEDAFQLQALENGAAYGSPHHMSAANPGAGVTPASGAMSVLGDAGVDRPMLAQIYTYPADPKGRVEVIVEAQVTEATCNRDLLGETITSVGGKATVTDLTVATPTCDAVGDILVLKNLAPDLKIAVN